MIGRIVTLSCLLAAGAALAESPPRFRPVQAAIDGEFRVQLQTSNGTFYRLETSTNAFDWGGWITFRGTGFDERIDTGAPYAESRFYRAVELVGTNHLTGDHLVTEDGEVVFHPVDHASFVMGWNGLMIYNDPVGGGGAYASLPLADLILVSHDHGDHYQSGTIGAVAKAEAKIVAPPDVFNQLSATLRAKALSLPNGSSTNVLGLNVRAVPAYNSRHALGDGNGYVLTIGNRRIYISGDTGDVAEMRALDGIDVAFLCMNEPFTMTVQAAADATRDFRPGAVYPYHYRNQGGSFSDLTSFKQLVGSDLGIEVRIRDWY